LAMVGG